MTSKDETQRHTGSYNSFGPIKKKQESTCHSHSQRMIKPSFRLSGVTKRLMKKVCKILHLKSVDPTGPEPVDFTLDESKLILRGIAQELDRIFQTSDLSLSTKVSEDGSSLEEREAFLLQWAEDLWPPAHAQEILKRQTGVSSPCDIVPEENRGEACKPKPEKDKRLKKAIGDLSTWTWTLSDKEEESVCLDEDVVEVVKDMMRQWKRGKLTNILPVMDFVIWSILQQDGQKGSIVKHWNRNQELLKNRAAPQQIPESVWKLITKRTAKVRLDPSTANLCLEIFNGRRALKMMEIIESIDNPLDDFRKSKKQFDGWGCALGSEGFVSGQHYWEVDVRGKSEWRIGVARESAPRNGFNSLNTTTGYQILRLQLGQLMAMTSPVTRLDRCAPSVLGLFLDMEEGQMSFYDVDHRFHIYSFNVSFDHGEAIFPVFGTNEPEGEIRILT